MDRKVGALLAVYGGQKDEEYREGHAHALAARRSENLEAPLEPTGVMPNERNEAGNEYNAQFI